LFFKQANEGGFHADSLKGNGGIFTLPLLVDLADLSILGRRRAEPGCAL